ncbi:sugar phosphate nucleotidyltransferase [Paenibacillus sp. SYP-B4298]|uniref:sugar phosphate nucleotidyltransferase n=1 Tax=Paenibacillus sp. SYP-B4298 TaxID=2996034 RepID=UPI0022DE6A29|nr:sugar phosphate nucleotidyltransferase [Paenibacillus sp. SYP-B4298]
MKLVLLSGGSGKRLWPLSNDARSKQFLKVLQNREGEPESMVQRVWGQIRAAGLEQETYIATSKSQVDMISSQLGERAAVVVEPERRDTFPAIALTAAYLYSVAGASLKETIVVMPVDPYVEAEFFDKLKELEGVLNRSQAELALIGVQPSSPSENYGYIVPDSASGDEAVHEGMEAIDGCCNGYRVHHFKEKPCKAEAEALLEQSALWNCGVFAFKLDYMINLLITLGLPIHYDEMLKQYSRMPQISFDYQVVEQAASIVVLPYAGSWRDLGTWEMLTGEMKRQVVGRGIVTEDAKGTCLINELDIPVTVLGASDLIVAASPDGILVSSKEQSYRIKEVLKGTEHRPMYEERRWGSYKVIDYVKYSEGNEVLTKRIRMKQGCNLSYQYHQKRNEVWTIIAGSGELILGGVYSQVSAGDVVKIPAEMLHSIRALSPLEIIEVQSGTELIEEDIYRLCLVWSDILEYCR